MIRRVVSIVGLGVFGAAMALAQALPPEGPTLQPLWTLAGDFAAPESAYYDAQSNAVFVSSINGQILEKDGNGYISRVSPDGKMVSAKWVTGLNAPKGIRSLGGTLWVSDIDEVVSIDIAAARVTARVKVEGAQFLNDVATAPDGTIYASDSNLARIYSIKDGKSSVFVEGVDQVDVPNGLLVDGTRLILGTIGAGPRGAGPGRGAGPPPSGHLYAFDLKTKQRTQLTMDAVGGIDGIEPDGRGGLLITDVIGARLLHVAASGQTRVLAKFSGGGADFGYIGSKRIAVVPFLNANSVSAYDLTASLK
jgi:DNA-binding beta-propeller fold protein YncE